jgi:hypothetical protein
MLIFNFLNYPLLETLVRRNQKSILHTKKRKAFALHLTLFAIRLKKMGYSISGYFRDYDQTSHYKPG